ncbi:MAG: hypothetical protein JXA57_20445 [Armatimonadetes bacterium]|nr:hypothetical protein [Armatimonadota bacterium]
MSLRDTRYGRSNLDKVSFGALVVYFGVVPFSDTLHRIVLVGSLVDTAWFIIFSLFLVLYVFDRFQRIAWSFMLTVILVWCGYILSLTLTDLLLHNDPSSSMYELRQISFSIPLAFLLVIRRTTIAEYTTMLRFLVLLAPMAIARHYADVGLESLADWTANTDSRYGTAYNTFVPFTTFPALAGLYLLTISRRLVEYIVYGVVTLVILGFIFVNPSRQSVYFVIVSVAVIVLSAKGLGRLLKSGLVILCLATLIVELNFGGFVVARFFSEESLETRRVALMMAEIDGIDGLEWVWGRGLGLTLQDGNPHNNYVFTVMRVGVIGALLLFGPFIVAFVDAISLPLRRRGRVLFDRRYGALVAVGLLFTLYHSFFGYPHLDTLNGPIAWLGLAMWIGFRAPREHRRTEMCVGSGGRWGREFASVSLGERTHARRATPGDGVPQREGNGPRAEKWTKRRPLVCTLFVECSGKGAPLTDVETLREGSPETAGAVVIRLGLGAVNELE